MCMLYPSSFIRVLSEIALCSELKTYKEAIESSASSQNSQFYLAAFAHRPKMKWILSLVAFVAVQVVSVCTIYVL